MHFGSLSHAHGTTKGQRGLLLLDRVVHIEDHVEAAALLQRQTQPLSHAASQHPHPISNSPTRNSVTNQQSLQM